MRDMTNTDTAKKLLVIIPRMMQVIASAVKNQQIHVPMIHYRLLRILMEHPMSLSQIAEHLMISKASLSETLNLIVEKGWIEKIQDPSDARRIFLKTTQAGIEQMERTDKEVLEVISARLSELSPEENLTVNEGADIISRVFVSPDSWRVD
jgi:DNA-binding MarR family transcriptional regulator